MSFRSSPLEFLSSTCKQIPSQTFSRSQEGATSLISSTEGHRAGPQPTGPAHTMPRDSFRHSAAPYEVSMQAGLEKSPSKAAASQDELVSEESRGQSLNLPLGYVLDISSLNPLPAQLQNGATNIRIETLQETMSGCPDLLNVAQSWNLSFWRRVITSIWSPISW